MPTQQRRIRTGPGVTQMSDNVRLPGHGLEVTFVLALPVRVLVEEIPNTPRRSDPELWTAYRTQGARVMMRCIKEVRINLYGLVAYKNQWRLDRSDWELFGLTTEGMSSFVPQNTKFRARYNHLTRQGLAWFTWAAPL